MECRDSFRRLAERVFDVEDLKQRTNELADFVAAVQHYKLAVDVGYSNGANIAASMLLLRPDILRAAILFRAMVRLVPEDLPNLSSVRVASAREIRTRSFQRLRISAWRNSFVARART